MMDLHVNRNQTFYLIVLGNLAAVALVGLFVLRPVFGALSTNTRQITQTRAETVALERKTTELRHLKEVYPTYASQYAPILDNLPKTKDTAGFQTELEDLAKLTSVQLRTVDTSVQAAGANQTAANTPQMVGGFPVIPAKVEILGSFTAVSDFINRLETMDRFTRLTGLELKSNDSSGQVKATVEMQTLYFPNQR